MAATGSFHGRDAVVHNLQSPLIISNPSAVCAVMGEGTREWRKWHQDSAAGVR